MGGSNSACVFWWGGEGKEFLAKPTFEQGFTLFFLLSLVWQMVGSICDEKNERNKLHLKMGTKQLAESRYTPHSRSDENLYFSCQKVVYADFYLTKCSADSQIKLFESSRIYES